eukprot:CAMPEP_0203787880 /NCGR_PEP_ID=MMETSP0100_2-20121128/2498_1 /ASSEMBLY_ACC=CAM_ASM_000210 /TAXON_ID=96639 /ORGANISM=" , Strain NY0313808BC1" /LENGTH=62 /DNA_ID=CAMNT_0050690483 /DNA_START=370 /DNA_END=555 /DNA_ORIENTATION=+
MDREYEWYEQRDDDREEINDEKPRAMTFMPEEHESGGPEVLRCDARAVKPGGEYIQESFCGW